MLRLSNKGYITGAKHILLLAYLMSHRKTQHGLRQNLQQFILLVVVNAFVGGMVGMERTIFPQFAHDVFGVTGKTAVLWFIVAFGVTKALTNYFTGKLANRFGRKNLLLAGWVAALPVPFMLMYATGWYQVVLANVLLGVSQGLTWSSTVVMKIDLVGEKDRGLAMGLNEFAGYFAVGLVAFITGYVATHYGITPYPFYIGVAISVTGLLLTWFLVEDTGRFVHQEHAQSKAVALNNVFLETTFTNKTLSAVTQAGLVNNLNDGMIWGLLPMLLAHLSYSTEHTGIITAIYPTVWGLGQLFTGKMADVYSKKAMLFWGMLLQGAAILAIPFTTGFAALAAISALLGAGTALVYPTFLTTIAQATAPAQRAESIGTFRLWRDLGYAFGAILSGIMADVFGLPAAIGLIGAITVLSALVIQFRMPAKTAPAKECIEVTEMQEALHHHGKVQVIDVRSKEEYEQAHIPEAINIALPELPQHLPQFAPDTLLVTVCGKGGGRSSEAAQLLKQMGYKAVWLCGGTNKWLAAA